MDVMKRPAVGGCHHNAAVVSTSWSVVGHLQILYFPILLVAQRDDAIARRAPPSITGGAVAILIDNDRLARRAGTFGVEFSTPAASSAEENAVAGSKSRGAYFFQRLPRPTGIDTGAAI
jgi:hypothetical protein